MGCWAETSRKFFFFAAVKHGHSWPIRWWKNVEDAFRNLARLYLHSPRRSRCIPDFGGHSSHGHLDLWPVLWQIKSEMSRRSNDKFPAWQTTCFKIALESLDHKRLQVWHFPSLRQDVRAFDIRARLCGVRVNFFRDQLMGSVWHLGTSKAHLDVNQFSTVQVWGDNHNSPDTDFPFNILQPSQLNSIQVIRLIT